MRPRRTELAFLPASLELQNTPPSPIGRAMLWALLLLLASAAAWSFWARIDIVASATGKVVPGSRVKVVQPFEHGTVASIHVREGDQVARGDLLIELDATEANARERLIEQRLEALRARQMRLAGLRRFVAAEPDPEGLPIEPEDTDERLLLLRERNQHTARLAQFDGQRIQLGDELDTVTARIDGLRGVAELVAQRGEALATLARVGHVATEAWLKVTQEQRGMETELAALEGQRRTLHSAMRNIERAREAYLTERLRELTDAELAAQRERAALEQELAAARHRLQRHRLHAPVAGRVQQLATHTIGGVVAPAQELLRIVPVGDELEIEAHVLNRDAGEVHPGMPAVVKLQAYPFTRYGTLTAQVVALSADALSDRAQGLVYKARVRLLADDPGTRPEMRLAPGMAATVEIRIGERRVIELLLNPLVRALKEAGREL